jgi:hypothetical protein
MVHSIIGASKARTVSPTEAIIRRFAGWLKDGQLSSLPIFIWHDQDQDLSCHAFQKLFWKEHRMWIPICKQSLPHILRNKAAACSAALDWIILQSDNWVDTIRSLLLFSIVSSHDRWQERTPCQIQYHCTHPSTIQSCLYFYRPSEWRLRNIMSLWLSPVPSCGSQPAYPTSFVECLMIMRQLIPITVFKMQVFVVAKSGKVINDWW